jgi:hypothetical protein
MAESGVNIEVLYSDHDHRLGSSWMTSRKDVQCQLRGRRIAVDTRRISEASSAYPDRDDSMPEAPPPPPRTDEPRVWPVVGDHLDTLNAIADGLALVHSILGKDADPGIALHILAGEYLETRELVNPVRLLAETLVEAASDADRKVARDAERAAAIESIKAAIEREHFRATRRTRKDALGDAGRAIREMGWELHDLLCVLATDRDDRNVIVVGRIPPPAAYAWLIEDLFQRAEAFVTVDENLAVERDASAWFFDCWSDGSQDGDPSYTDFPRMIREQEWSLVSRDTLSLDEPVIASLATDQQPEDVPLRQQQLATGYLQSLVGIFEIVAVDGPHVTVRDASTGQTHRYYEHNEDADPSPGLLILGRMIPLDQNTWLRSPGTIIITPIDDAYPAFLVNALTSLCESLPTPIALEALISLAIYGATVPVPRLAAPTIAAAHDTLAAVDDMLEAIGVFDDDESEGGIEERNDAEFERFQQRLDQSMSDWIGALNDQIELDSPRPDAQPAKRKKQRQAKQQSTRRRKR